MINRKSSEKWASVSVLDVALMILIGDWIVAALSKTPMTLMSEPFVLVFNIVWAAMPFAMIWLWVKIGQFKAHILLASLSGQALTFGGWLWYFSNNYKALTGQLSGGPNIGLGIVMIALPMLVLIGMGIIVMATRGRMPDDEI